MRLFPLAAGLAALAFTVAPASAQQRPAQQPEVQRLSASVGSAVVPRTHAGEVQRVLPAQRAVRAPGRLAARYKGIRANRTQPVRTRRLGLATPVLRAVSTQEGRLVRLNGTYFRVQR